MEKITIIGAGNGGLTAAYHFSKINFEVCLYDSIDFSKQIDAINNNDSSIEAVDKLYDSEMILSGKQHIDLATTDISLAMKFSHLVLIIAPSFAQEPIFKQMKDYITEDHIILMMPGNFGSLVLKKYLSDNNLPIPTIVDFNSIPWACRIEDDAKIAIMGIKEYIYAGVLPASKTTEVISLLNENFVIEVKALANVIVAGLENINYGGHPLITTLNIGLLENFDGQFCYYRDCCSTATAKASEKMENERIEIGKILNIDLIPELEMMNGLYNSNYKTVYDFNRDSSTHVKISSGPNSSHARYITEDVPYLLVPCYEFATLGNYRPTIIESCINLCNAFNDADYFTSGRTLDKMGIDNMSISDIFNYIN